MKSIEYRTNREVALTSQIMLPQHSFIKPMEWRWLPKHIQDNNYMWKNHKEYTMCYTKYGFFPIPNNSIDVC